MTVKLAQFEVRPATVSDAEALSGLWYRIMQERAQIDSRLRLADHAQALWQAELMAWLERDDVTVRVADQGGRLIGYVIGWLLARPTLQFQQRYGFISDLGVDGHAHQGGVGSALFEAIKPWFDAHDIERLEIQVMHQHPVAQAFWRGKGATPYLDYLWYRLRKVD
jgi:GNAT superfamily N-acetyltransferase